LLQRTDYLQGLHEEPIQLRQDRLPNAAIVSWSWSVLAAIKRNATES